MVEAPWAHPAWHSYSLILMHLRPMPDRRETLFYLDDATHEVWLYALNPDEDRNPLVESGIAKGCWLSPKNFAAQIVEITDDLARERVRAAVKAVCDGRLSPDTHRLHEAVGRPLRRQHAQGPAEPKAAAPDQQYLIKQS